MQHAASVRARALKEESKSARQRAPQVCVHFSHVRCAVWVL
jgi:hypothetical protein